ncbi:MAG TPA: methyltransferase domain-containing protein [Alphaproteobacteria bacterium]|nr:methyltransferase domain-containing protein [Alphaproteobacteria bacterium]
MDFSGDAARIQRSVARSHEIAVRRAAVFEVLAPCTGESVLEIGCGGGAYLRDVALAVGEGGRACGIDISADQIDGARAHCGDAPAAEFHLASALELPFDDGVFDAAFSVQVLEYIEAVDGAIAEAHRTLRPGGRFVHLATNWDSVVFNGGDAELMGRVLGAWEAHCHHPNLPAGMSGRLRRAGFIAIEQTPLPMLITANHAHSFTFWAAQLMAGFAAGQGAVTPEEAQAWLADLTALDAKGEFFYSAMTVITRARKAG